MKLAWTDMTQRLSEVALDVVGDEAVLWGLPGGPAEGGVRAEHRHWL